MNQATYSAYRQAGLLVQALSSDKARIAFLLGAGCPVSVKNAPSVTPLIPDIAGLTAYVREQLSQSPEHSPSYTALISRIDADSSIEEVLTYLRSWSNVLRSGDIPNITVDSLGNLDKEICRLITEKVNVDLPNVPTPYHQLAAWVGGIQRSFPVEIFTPNYDLLVEQAFEAHRIPFFDGFVGSKDPFFDLASMENDVLPARWVRLWKVHGSVNWWSLNGEITRRSSGGAGHSSGEERQMIYPSHLKYDQSRRMPYLAMLDRLRAFLASGQAILVTCGYSFSDRHLNDVILSGLRGNPTAHCFGLLFGAMDKYKGIDQDAAKHANISLLAEDSAILGTQKARWNSEVIENSPLHGIAVKEPQNARTNCQFLLGDFKAFGELLARQLSDVPDNQEAASAS